MQGAQTTTATPLQQGEALKVPPRAEGGLKSPPASRGIEGDVTGGLFARPGTLKYQQNLETQANNYHERIR
jgi:hypothetical protein